MTETDIRDLVLRAMNNVNLARKPEARMQVAADAAVFGGGSPLDSLGLVSLLIDIEEALEDRGHTVTLSDARAMSATRSPFRSVPALVDYIRERLPTVPVTARRRVLITGASRGLGARLVEHFLAQDVLVIGCARGESAFTDERYVHARLDVTDEVLVRELFADLRKRFGGLDVLINNAGIASMNPVALTPYETAREIMATNFLGTFLFTHAALRLLRSSSAGRIVNFTTVAVPMRLEGEAIYAASKSAVETFTRIVAREAAPLGITCNAVGPSPVRTQLTQNVGAERIERLLRRQAIPRWAEPADVANVIDFFIRPESAFVTGQVVYLGGAG